MPRTRVISQVESLYTTTSPSIQNGTQTGIQLHRIQSCSQSWQVSRINISEFGLLSPLSREINDSPTSSVDFSYYITNFLNEQNLGFVTDGSTTAISGIINETEDEKNYFLVESAEGVDAVGDSSSNRVVYGIGNGFLSSYSSEAQVGGFPTATVRVEGLNLAAYAAPSGVTPAVNPENGIRGTGLFTIPTATSGLVGQSTILKHGDITMSLGSSAIGVDLTDAKIQRYTLSFNLNREPQNKFGSKFAFARTITFPVEVNLSVEANQGDISASSVDALLCSDAPQTLSITLAKPSCSGSGPVAASYTLIGAKLNGANWSSNIGSNQTVTLNYSSTIGGPGDNLNALIFSGILT